MAEGDPGFWKLAAEWLWAVVLIPLATIWKKVDGSASRAELSAAIRDAENKTRLLGDALFAMRGEMANNLATKAELTAALAAIEKGSEKLRASVIELYGNAEQDRRRYEDRFREMQKSIHEAELTIVKGIGRMNS